jgi:uncharacterized membrane protein YdbT with pleckstrin-like domain
MRPFPSLPDDPPEIEMTLDGRVLDTHAEGWTSRLFRYGVMVAAVAGLLALAALAFWLAVIMIPVALIAAALAYGAFRFRLWRLGGGGRPGCPFR